MFQASKDMRPYLLSNLMLGILTFYSTWCLVPIIQKYTLKAGLFGMDINKRGTPGGEIKIPESLGLATGCVYLISTLFSQFFYLTDSTKLLEFNSACLSITLMIFLGFADDVLDLPWRYKMLLPSISCLPILISYSGVTDIILPQFAFDLIGTNIVHLGFFYYVYMGMLGVFCTNAINIHAGINGLEAGQSFIIAIFVLLLNIKEFTEQGDIIRKQQHLLSIFITTPFLASTGGLLVYNWYPSKVFVGDTYTMFAGMTLAVAGILGHFSKTMLLFFIPQIINFLMSLPQIIGLWGLTCPRHRLPKYDQETKLLKGVPNYWNLVNQTLVFCGDMSEENLCILLMLFQILCCCIGTMLGYTLFQWS